MRVNKYINISQVSSPFLLNEFKVFLDLTFTTGCSLQKKVRQIG